MQVSRAESQVMEYLWAHPSATAGEVCDALGPENDWSEATVKTLLNRLLNKGAIDAERDGRRFRYVAVLRREDWLLSESSRMVDRLFDGRLAPLVSHFSDHGKLSRRDLEELRELIERLDDEH
ncbi:MAG: BlaI/MecI/CopY family transcriptional regulator [Candidatus Wenzhouxiangella sp. M2_3B_020]